MNSKSASEQQRLFVDGAGMRPDGTGSGYAWINETTRTHVLKSIDGLTNNQAEYRALISALKNLPLGSAADIFSDSQLLCEQFARNYKVRDPELKWLLARVREVIDQRHLTIRLFWIPREQNVAGKLLETKFRVGL